MHTPHNSILISYYTYVSLNFKDIPNPGIELATDLLPI